MTWIPIAVLLVILATALWVYTDARTRSDRGSPVALSIGSLELTSPTAWFVACLILWILFFPAYIVMRNQSD
jgi:heme/copper-type cytochrome/quinol oxidase subunit 2